MTAISLYRNSLGSLPVRALQLCIAAIVAVALMMSLSAPNAHAISVQFHWYGAQVLLNRGETNDVALGAGGVGLVASRIPYPWVRAAAFGLSAYGLYANWVFNRNRCVYFGVRWLGPLYEIGSYAGGYCR